MTSLDGVRGLAIAAVMLYHGWVYTGDAVVGRALEQVRATGWAGVDLFFVLSGFLITGILLDARGKPGYWRNFLIRRGLRIFPLYYAVLLALLVGGLALRAVGLGHIDQSLENLDRIWVNFLYLTDFWIGFRGEDQVPIDIAWSLAIEEQFYLVFPAIVLWLRERRLAALLLGLVLAAPAIRWLTHVYGAQPTLGPYALPHCRIDALAIGALLRVALHLGYDGAVATLARLFPVLAALAIGAMVVWERKHGAFIVVGYSLNAVAAASLIALLVRARADGLSRRIFENRVLVYFGKLSYGLYLFHLFVRAGANFGLAKAFGRVPQSELWYVAAQFTLMMGLSVLVATVSFAVFEQPILKLKDRWAPTRPVAIRGAAPDAK